MILTITFTPADDATPATDLGYLLHKHPGRLQSFDLAFGTAHVFYPEATPERCSAALLLEVDPVGLVRGRRAGSGGDATSLGQYVNDRPYAASSLMTTALTKVFRTAMTGRCDSRPSSRRPRSRWRSPFQRCRAGAAWSWPGGSSSRSAGA